MVRSPWVRLVAVALALLALSSCAGGGGSASGLDGGDGIYYTAVNIWWYKAKRIYSTNYHTGERIRVGTQVRVTGISNKAIDFQTMDGKEYRIVYAERHTRQTMQELFKQYFSKTNEMGPGGKFQRFTAREQEAIKAGIVERGMSKPAVLMAYGYPPSHRTASLDSDIWIYFTGLYAEHKVHFENGRTVNALY